MIAKVFGRLTASYFPNFVVVCVDLNIFTTFEDFMYITTFN